MPNASEAGDRPTTGVGMAVPVPDRLTAALPLLASEPTVSVAVRAPTAAGVKV